MREFITRSAIAILLVTGTACGSSDPTAPPVTGNQPGISVPAPPAPPPAPTNFPAPSGPARVLGTITRYGVIPNNTPRSLNSSSKTTARSLSSSAGVSVSIEEVIQRPTNEFGCSSLPP
jgi:hypothetical protein